LCDLELWFFIGGGGSPEAAPHGSWIYNPLFQVTAGVVGMFIIITVIGESLVWLRGEFREILNELREPWS